MEPRFYDTIPYNMNDSQISKFDFPSVRSKFKTSKVLDENRVIKHLLFQ